MTDVKGKQTFSKYFPIALLLLAIDSFLMSVPVKAQDDDKQIASLDSPVFKFLKYNFDVEYKGKPKPQVYILSDYSNLYRDLLSAENESFASSVMRIYLFDDHNDKRLTPLLGIKRLLLLGKFFYLMDNEFLDDKKSKSNHATEKINTSTSSNQKSNKETPESKKHKELSDLNKKTVSLDSQDGKRGNTEDEYRFDCSNFYILYMKHPEVFNSLYSDSYDTGLYNFIYKMKEKNNLNKFLPVIKNSLEAHWKGFKSKILKSAVDDRLYNLCKSLYLFSQEDIKKTIDYSNISSFIKRFLEHLENKYGSDNDLYGFWQKELNFVELTISCQKEINCKPPLSPEWEKKRISFKAIINKKPVVDYKYKIIEYKNITTTESKKIIEDNEIDKEAIAAYRCMSIFVKTCCDFERIGQVYYNAVYEYLARASDNGWKVTAAKLEKLFKDHPSHSLAKSGKRFLYITTSKDFYKEADSSKLTSELSAVLGMRYFFEAYRKNTEGDIEFLVIALSYLSKSGKCKNEDIDNTINFKINYVLEALNKYKLHSKDIISLVNSANKYLTEEYRSQIFKMLYDRLVKLVNESNANNDNKIAMLCSDSPYNKEVKNKIFKPNNILIYYKIKYPAQYVEVAETAFNEGRQKESLKLLWEDFQGEIGRREEEKAFIVIIKSLIAGKKNEEIKVYYKKDKFEKICNIAKKHREDHSAESYVSVIMSYWALYERTECYNKDYELFSSTENKLNWEDWIKLSKTKIGGINPEKYATDIKRYIPDNFTGDNYERADDILEILKLVAKDCYHLPETEKVPLTMIAKIEKNEDDIKKIRSEEPGKYIATIKKLNELKNNILLYMEKPGNQPDITDSDLYAAFGESLKNNKVNNDIVKELSEHEKEVWNKLNANYKWANRFRGNPEEVNPMPVETVPYYNMMFKMNKQRDVKFVQKAYNNLDKALEQKSGELDEKEGKRLRTICAYYLCMNDKLLIGDAVVKVISEWSPGNKKPYEEKEKQVKSLMLGRVLNKSGKDKEAIKRFEDTGLLNMTLSGENQIKGLEFIPLVTIDDFKDAKKEYFKLLCENYFSKREDNIARTSIITLFEDIEKFKPEVKVKDNKELYANAAKAYYDAEEWKKSDIVYGKLGLPLTNNKLRDSREEFHAKYMHSWQKDTAITLANNIYGWIKEKSKCGSKGKADESPWQKILFDDNNWGKLFKNNASTGSTITFIEAINNIVSNASGKNDKYDSAMLRCYLVAAFFNIQINNNRKDRIKLQEIIGELSKVWNKDEKYWNSFIAILRVILTYDNTRIQEVTNSEAKQWMLEIKEIININKIYLQGDESKLDGYKKSLINAIEKSKNKDDKMLLALVGSLRIDSGTQNEILREIISNKDLFGTDGYAVILRVLMEKDKNK